MQQEDTPTAAPEETTEYVEESTDSIIADFTDILGLAQPEKPQPTEAQPEETSTEAPPSVEAGAPAVELEHEPATEAVPVNTNDAAVDPLATSSDKSQVIADKAAIEAAKRDTEQAQKQAIEQARAEARQEVYKDLRLDPQRWLAENAEALGIPVGEFAMHAYRVALGDQAPPELVKRTQRGPDAIMSEVERRFAEQEKRLEQRERELEIRATAQRYEEFINNVPEQHAYMRAAAETNRDVLKQNLFNIADAYAEQNGRYPTTSELAAEYNRQVDQVVKLHKLNASTPAPAPLSKTEQPQPKKPAATLSESMSDRRSGESSEEDLTDEALERAAYDYLQQNPIQF